MAEAAPLLQAFVSAGGGLLTGAQAWFWAYTSPVEQHPMNVLLAPMGIIASPEVTSADYTFGSTPPSQLGNAELALTCLAITYQGNTTSHYLLDSSQQVATATMSVVGAARVLPLTGSFWAKLQQVRLDGWLAGWLDGWMAGWLDGWMAGWLDGWMAGWLDGWMAIWPDGRMAGWLDGWMAGWLDGWMAGWLDGWMAGCWMAGWLDGWMAGWLDGWMAGWLDGWMAAWDHLLGLPTITQLATGPKHPVRAGRTLAATAQRPNQLKRRWEGTGAV